MIIVFLYNKPRLISSFLHLLTLDMVGQDIDAYTVDLNSWVVVPVVALLSPVEAAPVNTLFAAGHAVVLVQDH